MLTGGGRSQQLLAVDHRTAASWRSAMLGRCSDLVGSHPPGQCAALNNWQPAQLASQVADLCVSRRHGGEIRKLLCKPVPVRVLCGAHAQPVRQNTGGMPRC
jgi:hypothetical protein